MNAKRILLTAVCGLLVLGGPAAAQELGDGRGIDHVAALVRPESFDAAGEVWSDDLGFALTPALLSLAEVQRVLPHARPNPARLSALGAHGQELRQADPTLARP